MTDPYVAILATAAGGAIALLGVFFTNHSNTARLKIQLDHKYQQRKIELLRSRGEELYELTDKWLNEITLYSLQNLSIMEGKLARDQYFDAITPESKRGSIYFGRIKMLVDVYFPSVRPLYDKVTADLEKLNIIIATEKTAYKTGYTDADKFIVPFFKLQQSIVQSGDAFLTSVLESIRNIE